MMIIIDYGNSKTEFNHVRYNVCKAVEEILHEVEYGGGIVSREVVVDTLHERIRDGK